MPLAKLRILSVSYFKDAYYLDQVAEHFDRTQYQYVNPFLSIAYSGDDPAEFVFYGFKHLSDRRVRFDTRLPTDFEIEVLAASISEHPWDPTDPSVLSRSRKPAAQVIPFSRPSYYRKRR